MDTIYNPKIPFSSAIRGGLNPGKLIRIQGKVESHAKCFGLNLETHSGDIALHLSPVFNSPTRVVRNSLINQIWGPEESHGPPFPFYQGQDYEILILVESDHFKIAINGEHYAEFQNRLPLDSIAKISINGDTHIKTITFEGSNSMSSSGSGIGFAIPEPDMTPVGPPLIPYTPNAPNFPPAPAYSPVAPQSFPVVPPPAYSPQPGPYATQTGGYTPQPGAYPSQPGPYPTQSYPSQPGGAYPTQLGGAYPIQPGGYPTQPGGAYPTQHGGYPQGTNVQYPHSPSKSGGGGGLLSSAAGLIGGTGLATALAGAALGGHKHKKAKKGHKGGFLGSNAIPIGLAAGGTALAGAMLMGKSPLKHVMKPKKLKKLYKHKHKGWGSSSSSSD